MEISIQNNVKECYSWSSANVECRKCEGQGLEKQERGDSEFGGSDCHNIRVIRTLCHAFFVFV